MKTIGIIGLGYVGLPLLINFSKVFHVIGFDSSIQKVESINKKESYINHIDLDALDQENGGLPYATNDMSLISKVDAIIICVPTPITKHREPDLSYVEQVVEDILPYLKKGQLISLESTTYPGTTEEVIYSRIKESGFVAGKDIYLTYSPERENPGSKYPLHKIPKVIGGVSKKCTATGKEFYSKIFDEVVEVSSVKVAELSKLLENIHRAVNLGMINEFKMICDAMSVDPFEVIDAASTKPFGFVPYYPGPGWGGHCIPVDPFYLSWKVKEYGMTARFIELAGEINSNVQKWVLEKISSELNRREISVKGSKILLLGLSYKPNVDDARESPSLNIFASLVEQGASVEFSDPFFKNFPKTRKYNFSKESVELNEENIKRFDLVLLLTNHDSFDLQLIKEHSKLIIDTKGVFSVSEVVIRA